MDESEKGKQTPVGQALWISKSMAQKETHDCDSIADKVSRLLQKLCHGLPSLDRKYQQFISDGKRYFLDTLKLTVCYLGYTGEKYPPLPNQNVQFTASLPPSSPSLNQIILFIFSFINLHYIYILCTILFLYWYFFSSPHILLGQSVQAVCDHLSEIISNSYYCITCTHEAHTHVYCIHRHGDIFNGLKQQNFKVFLIAL